jgi:hypothetical protein
MRSFCLFFLLFTGLVHASVEGKVVESVDTLVATYPEILWLSEAGERATQEGIATSEELLPSQRLFGHKEIEFDRTLMTLRALHLFLEGGDQAYALLTQDQPESVRLSRNAFDKIHSTGVLLLYSGHQSLSPILMKQTMETALILGDLGKTNEARRLLAVHQVSAPDHDDFLDGALQVLANHPELCPSFLSLPPEGRQLILRSTHLAHYGHITHIEGGLSMFHHLEVKAPIPLCDLLFDLFIHTCDVAGALGHVNPRSSLTYTEPTHKAMDAMHDAVLSFAKKSATAKSALEAYLTKRAAWLGFDPSSQEGRILTRVGTMLRLTTLEEGAALRQGWELLSSKDRDLITGYFDPLASSSIVRTPTYVPALLVNLANHPTLGATKIERLAKVVNLGLPFVAKVLEQHSQALQQDPTRGDVPLCFNHVAGQVKQDPSLLAHTFLIDTANHIVVITPPCTKSTETIE